MSSDEIDALLERYLTLLNQYTTLRKDLTTLQSSIHQDIARANFSTERGHRYGRDSYDDRLQASRRIEITSSTADVVPEFSLTLTTADRHIRDPLGMFGLLAPAPLRRAQTSAIQMVQEMVPRLATLDAAMRAQEICIRRARKRLGRAGTRVQVAEGGLVES